MFYCSRLKGGKWEVVRGLPDDAPKRVLGEKTSPEEMASVRNLLDTNEISLDNYFLQNKVCGVNYFRYLMLIN